MNRREAIAALTAMPGLTSIQRVDVRPKDTIVLEFDGHISIEKAQRIRHQLEEIFPNNKCLVLGEGMKLKAVREA